MLVLDCKPGQRVFVPHLGLTVTVVALTGGKVRLGFEAPPEVAVWREEVLWGADEPAGAVERKRRLRLRTTDGNERDW